jgi:hypothetical protein
MLPRSHAMAVEAHETFDICFGEHAPSRLIGLLTGAA